MQQSSESQQTDLKAMNIAKQYMGEFGAPTVVLALSCAIIYIGAPLLFIAGKLSVGLTIVVMSVVTYAIYTVMHDAVHRAIQGQHRNIRWLNEWMGYLSAQILMIPFTAHRRSHLAHHAHTNDAAEDPDFHLHQAGQSPFQLLYLSARSGFDQYTYYMTKCWQKTDSREKTIVVLELVLAVTWRAALIMYGQGHWPEILLLFVASAILGNAITVYFFAYLVHKPHDQVGRWIDTSTFVFRNRVGRAIDWLWLFQNYHSIHHLYPRVPFYRYRQLFENIEDVMVAKGAPITYVSAWNQRGSKQPLTEEN